jgi:hypothetical protein
MTRWSASAADMRAAVIALAVAWVVASGCAAVAPPSAPGDGTEGGPGVPVLKPGQPPIVVERQGLVGSVVVEANGCFRAILDDGRSLFVIWPAGATQGDRGDAVRSGGRTFANGDPFRAVGAVVPIAMLPDPGYWREAHLAFCDPEASEVLVLDAIE